MRGHTKLKTNYIFLLLFFISSGARAFPEMVRHGYSNCIACHISPSGGGVLNPYGRSLASELLTYNWSNTSKGKEKKSDANAEAAVSKWLTGGDIRALLFHRNNEYENSYLSIPMQVEMTGAYNTDKYVFVLGAALSGSKPGSSGEGGTAFRIPNAYGLYRINDEINIRAGQFLPTYGLNNSLHATGPRAPLGFGFKDQRMGVELSYLAEKWGLVVSQFGNRGPKLGDSASTAQLQYSPTEKSKFAINYWTENNLRTISGLWFVTPLYGASYLTADYNVQKDTSTNSDGLYYYTKLGYELKQGMHLYLVNDHSQRDLDRSYTKVDRIGPGFQLFPMLHWEFDAVWLREKNLMYSKKEADYVYILAHYYL